MAESINNSHAPATPKPEAATGAAPLPCSAADQAASAEADAKANKLSKEEQMAAFEEDLKYNDWGHQPC